MKRFVSLALSLILVCTLLPTVFAASNESTKAANTLHTLGLFNGTGKDASGNPIYDLDRVPTRNEAVTMLVNLLGKGDEAKKGTWDTPFTDVADWAKPYVGYAYVNDLTSGTSATTYDGGNTVTASQYLTFVLRALGYKNGIDFQWDRAWELSDKLGITNGQYNAESAFTRGDVAIISLNALSCKINGGNQTLLGKLYEDDVVSLTSIEMVDMLKETGHETISTPSNLEIVQQGSDYILTWTAPYENVTNYDVYVSTEYNGEYSLFSTPSNSYIPLTDSVLYDLNDDTIYYFKVRAVKWDETKEQRYFSDLSAPISYQVTKTNNAPLNVVSQITNYLSDAAQNEQNALYMCQAAMTATSAYYGKYYAERAQEYYAKIEVDIEAAIELCGDYDNLADLKVPFATIYSLNVYAANYQITSTNYLSYVIETSTHASALTDYYEQSLAIIKTIIAEY